MLFADIFQLYYKCVYDRNNKCEQFPENAIDKELIKKMSHYHHTLVQLIPYKFVILKESVQDDLARMSCCVWGDILVRLAEGTESFKEQDVECLLDLKHLAPCVPNLPVRSVLEKVLSRFFQMASSPDGVGEISGEKIAALSQWVHDLDLVNTVDKQLKESHELWKKTHGHAANERTMALSKSDVPSASVQGLNNSRKIPRPVVLNKRKRATVSVITGQVIPDDALSPYESEKTLSREKILTRSGVLPLSLIHISEPTRR